jgi:hypothetical protein
LSGTILPSAYQRFVPCQSFDTALLVLEPDISYGRALQGADWSEARCLDQATTVFRNAGFAVHHRLVCESTSTSSNVMVARAAEDNAAESFPVSGAA